MKFSKQRRISLVTFIHNMTELIDGLYELKSFNKFIYHFCKEPTEEQKANAINPKLRTMTILSGYTTSMGYLHRSTELKCSKCNKDYSSYLPFLKLKYLMDKNK